MTRVLVASLAFIVAPAFGQDKENPLSGDIAKAQGKWTAKAGPNMDIPIEMELTGTKAIIHATTPDGVDVEISGEFQLDEKATPKKLDFLKRKLNGEDFPDGEAIYKLEGDTLTICGGNPGAPRPTEFKANEEGQAMLIVFKRTKGPDKPAAAPDQAKVAIEGDLGKLQGDWKGMVGPQRNVPLTITFKDKAVSFKLVSPEGQEFVMEGAVKLDESANPKTIDWLDFKTPNGDDAPPNKGIYKFENDKWVVCNGGPNNPRPTEFKQGENGPPNIIEFERSKK